MINIAHLNYFDLFCLFIVAGSIIMAFFKGFINTTLSLIRFVASLYITFNFSHLLVPITSKYISHHAVAEYAAFIGLFLITLVMMSIIKHYILKILAFIDQGYVDRVFGALFGLIRGVAIVCVVFFTVICFTGAVDAEEKNKIASFKYIKANSPQWIQNAQLENQLLEYTKILVAILPQDLWNKIIDILVSKAEEKQITNFNPNDASSKIMMVKKLSQLLGSNDKAKGSLDLLSGFENGSKDQQKQVLEKFLAEYNNNVVKDVNFEDHKKILEVIDKLQSVEGEVEK